MLRRTLRNTAITALATAALGLGATSAQANIGSLDLSYGAGGFVTSLFGTQAAGIAPVVQPNGDVVSAGAAVVGGTSVIMVNRTLPNGTLDSSFGNMGTVLLPIGKNAYADAIALQSNGDIVVAGTGRSPTTGTLSMAAVRLLPNGQPDSTFGIANSGIALVPVGSDATANAVAILTNGQLILGGTVTTNSNHFATARLNANGSVDTSYGTNGITILSPNAAAWGMVLQPGGSVVLGGQQAYNGTQAYMAARVLANGTPDAGFGQQGIVTIPIGSIAAGMAIALEPTGDIVMTGNAAVGGAHVVPTVRLLPNGTLDPSFGSGGIASFSGSGVNAITFDRNNGDILLGGAGPSAVGLNNSGALDTGFGKRGLALATVGLRGSANGITVAPNGKIVLTGATTLAGHMSLAIARLNAS